MSATNRAARKLEDESKSEPGVDSLIKYAIPMLSGMLSCGDDKSEEHVVATFNNLLPDGILGGITDDIGGTLAVKIAARESGAIPRLVALLTPDSLGVARVLARLAYRNPANIQATFEAGIVPRLKTMLGRVTTLRRETACFTCMIMQQISCSEPNNVLWRRASKAICEAEIIPQLVTLLSDTEPSQSGASKLANQAAVVIAHISDDTDNYDVLIAAGAIAPLVALLSAVTPEAERVMAPPGWNGEAHQAADHALHRLVEHAGASSIIFSAVISAAPPLADLPKLAPMLVEKALTSLLRAEAGEDVDILVAAIGAVEYLQAPNADELLERARARVEALEVEAESQRRRESLGLGDLQVPAEFVCPITHEKMVDPVVASDGHSYERAAIELVFSSGNGRSPLTREELTPGVLIANINLRKRIRDHDEEVLQIGRAVRAREAAKAAAAAAPSADEADGNRPADVN